MQKIRDVRITTIVKKKIESKEQKQSDLMRSITGKVLDADKSRFLYNDYSWCQSIYSRSSEMNYEGVKV